MSETGSALAGLGLCDIDVMGWGELNRILAIGNLVVIKREASPHPQESVIDQKRDGAVVGMVIDGPMSKDDVRFFGLQYAPERFVMSWIHDGLAVDLTGIR